jgi:signal transduction histidine kinase
MNMKKNKTEVTDSTFVFHILVFLYCAGRYTFEPSNSLFILYSVIYLVIAFGIYIIPYSVIRLGANGLIILYLIFLTQSYPLFSCYIPVHVFQIIHIFDRKTDFDVLLAVIPALFIRDAILLEYCFISLILYVFSKRLKFMKARIAWLDKKNERLESDLDRLKLEYEQFQESSENIKNFMITRERKTLIQLLHDDLSHLIYGSATQLEAAKMILRKNPDQAESILEKVLSILHDGITRIRDTIKEQKPPEHVFSLNKIRMQLKEFEIQSGIKTEIKFSGDLREISAKMWKTVHLNLKEVLTNAMKYSEADKFSFCLEILNKVIKIEMKDNGKGNLNIRHGFGLDGIEERTEDIQGQVIVDGSKGFSVIMLLKKEG